MSPVPAQPVPPAAARARYRRSGRVEWLTFLPVAALALVAAVGMAVLLHLAFVSGWYIIILAPALAVLPLTALIALAVGAGRCRSALVAGGFGVAVGLVMYLGHFHAG